MGDEMTRTDQKTISALSRIEALAFAFGNADSLTMKAAAQNAANNCPAFWHRAGGSNDLVGSFMHYLNQTQDVLRAIAAYEAAYGPERGLHETALLDYLLPLNREAAKSLAEAYEEASTFRTFGELLSRTYRAEDRALEALGALRRNGGTKPAVLDHARVAASEAAIADHREANAFEVAS